MAKKKGRGWHGDSKGHSLAAKRGRRKGGRQSNLSKSARLKKLGGSMSSFRRSMIVRGPSRVRADMKRRPSGKKTLLKLGAREYAIEKLGGGRSMRMGVSKKGKWG